METNKNWLRELIPFGGTLVGLVMTVIGSSMILNTVLKVYIFGFETSSSFSAEERCEDEYRFTIEKNKNEEVAKERTAEETEECITRKTKLEKERYLRQKKENMVDGMALILVGAPVWFFYQRKRKNKKA